jgi:hypothetical protein
VTELAAFLDAVEAHPKFIKAAAMDPRARDAMALLRCGFGQLYTCGMDNPVAIELLDELHAIVRQKGSLRRRWRRLIQFSTNDIDRYPV